MTTPGMIPIGVLAKRSGVLAETIRYYETEGLLRKPERSLGGYRLYDASDVERLSFIRQARDLGFKLDAVRRLLGLADRKANTCDEVRELAIAHLAEVRTKLADLRRMERVLSDLVRSCAGTTVPECQLLQALAAPRTKAALPTTVRRTGVGPAKSPTSIRGARSRHRIK
ncbi:helix-turn-helix domain-containing protein [Reyranella sp.]|uniref:MerR family transcriptional regulator n=1 Tax=Reyranella sp. TaxID=1929291 RepID=UPI00121AD472|nr:MAG: MerR family transcriptional regulator [Reyranella sp.]